MSTVSQQIFQGVTGNPQTTQATVNSISKDIETDIVSFTVPALKQFLVIGGSSSGTVDITFKLYIDGLLKEILRNAWTERNVNFSVFELVSAGKIIKITGEHQSLNPHNFDASVFGSLLNI